jgi:2-polyprenyl-6-methoxyphenol hydroxylase-like FAD-dependent oxidoreductase
MQRPLSDPEETMARIGAGRFLVMLNRHDYWQCAFVIHKGGDAELRARGLENFREEVARLAPFARGRVGELNDWDKIKLLTVAIDRLEEWSRPGLLCIGDAAHAMSPVGGVGINLAIQDAVAMANRLAEPLREKRVTPEDLQAVQRRRTFPTRATQFMQTVVQKNVLQKVLSDRSEPRVPWLLRLISSVPLLQRLPAYFVGIGVRPEHIETPKAAQKNA